MQKFIIILLAAISLLPAHLSSPADAKSDITKNVVAKAEAAVNKVKKACAADVKTYCPKVIPGEGRTALCMMAHEDQISDPCYVAILDVADGIELALSNIWRAAEACEADMDKFCATVEPGEGRIAQCLINTKSNLASACRVEDAGFEARMKK